MIYFKKRFIYLFLILGFLALSGSGCHPFGQKPEEAVKKMTEAMSTINSFSYQLTANITSQKINEEKPDGQLVLTLNGDSHLVSSSEANLQTSFLGNLLIDGNSAKPTTIPLSAEIRLVKQTLYLKINKATDYPYFDLSDFKDKWYNFSQVKNNVLNKNTNLPVNNFTEEQLKNLRQLVANSSFFKVTQVLKEESIQNISCNHYEVSLNPDGIKTFIGEAVKIAKSSFIGQNSLDNFLTESAALKGEIWVGQKDYYLYQIKIDDSRLTEDKEATVKTKININLSAFNQLKDISAPEESTSLDFNEILNSYLGGVKTEILNFDSDQDGLADYLETVYQTDPKNPDTDHDGFLDGEEVKNGYNPKGEGKLEAILNQSTNNNANN